MENDEGLRVDLYIPRKCSATNRLISAKEHSSIQMNVGQVFRCLLSKLLTTVLEVLFESFVARPYLSSERARQFSDSRKNPALL